MAQTLTISQLSYPEHCIKGKMTLPSYDTGDAVQHINNAAHLENWKTEFIKRYGAEGTITIDERQVWYDLYMITGNARFDDWRKRYCDSKAETLRQWGSTD